MLTQLSERQKLILNLVIHEHTHSTIPVGSKTLVDKYQLDMSSATVRNELSFLTEAGYLRQPYTSAGREPTEEGYRYFVGHLLKQQEIPVETRHMITHQFYQSRRDVEHWMRLAASVLATHSNAASWITAPHSENSRLKHVELISTRGHQILLVIVMMGGELVQRFVTLEEHVSQEELSSISRRITEKLQGLEIYSIKSNLIAFQGLESEVVGWIIEEMDRLNSFETGEIYLDGLTKILSEPEFSESDDARRAVRLLEEKSLLHDLLERSSYEGESLGDVQVLIGGEDTWDELRQFSLVIGRYGSPGFVTGALGVFGPMRMYYARTISAVRFMSALLSDLFSEFMME